jgi:outer membrane receptor protein involved in Fe transport
LKLKKSHLESSKAFRQKFLSQALSLAFGATLISVGTIETAFAQSNATGTVYGTAASGSNLVLTNKETGFKRSVNLDNTGRFSLGGLPVGSYSVQVVKDGKVVNSNPEVDVRIGQGTEISFTDTVVVTGTQIAKKLDMTEMGSTTIFTAKELQRIPVANNVGAIIQLAPGTTSGDSRYGGSNAPSFGGASASENAYYINGFPVTNALTQVGFSQLPFNSIAQAQILTGGYGAEFGRSTGGVVNIITKSGSNEVKLGGGITWSPNTLRATTKDQYYADNGTALANKLYYYNSANTTDSFTTTGYFSAPIIKDKLFIYYSGERSTTDFSGIRTGNTSASYTASAATQSSSWQETSTTVPRYLLKLDWNITDDHHLEYTRLEDKYTSARKYFGFDYKTLQRTNVQNGGQTYINWGSNPVASQQGSEADILKYTGYFTKDLTFTAVLGRTKSPHKQLPVGYNPALPQINSDSTNEVPGLGPYAHGQTISGNLLVPGAVDTNKGIRLDVEYKLNSQHTLRAGMDKNTINSVAGNGLAGGYRWDYYKSSSPGDLIDGKYAAANSITNNTYGAQGYYAQQVFVNSLSAPSVDQTAQYIEDRWQVNDKLLLSLGLRSEGFNNKNGDGKSFINLQNQIAPRFGATFDALGDQTLKVFGNAGRYHVPLPTNVAVRAAGASLYTKQNFVYTGVDANGQPTGLTSISPVYSSNNEFGQSKDPQSVAALNMKGNYQDELAFGFERAVSKSLNYGAKFTYRTLRSAIDDHCDDRPFRAWAARNGVTPDANWGYNCALFNPGVANSFMMDYGDGKGMRRVDLSAQDLGVDKVQRIYKALDVFAEHPFDGKWYGRVAYTYSRNYGNTEGQTLSDIGQADVATTQQWDYPEFSKNAVGLLPNHRTHQLKMFGYYQVDPEWGVGANVALASGRPRNCIGNAPDKVGSTNPNAVTDYASYGSAYFYCGGVATPRGSQGSLPYTAKLDLNVAYQPAPLKGLTLKVDVFNVLNRQSVEVIEERYNSGSAVRALYSTPLSYTAPRSARISAYYDYKF